MLAIAPRTEQAQSAERRAQNSEPKNQRAMEQENKGTKEQDSIQRTTNLHYVPTLQRSPKGYPAPMLFLAIICFVCAFFTKQTAVAGP
jgi:hypothetical protein